jgi:NADH dehydrogenase
VVVVGAGFGGLETARRLAAQPVDVVLVDRHNYHLFTPLLYQVATAGLEPEEIAHPVRAILRGRTNIRFLVAEVQRVDLTARTVFTSEGILDYDYLVLAAGSTTSFFGIAGAERGAHGLKDADEAMALRNHILGRFEAAAWERDTDDRAALLTFVVVGGGPTGVEFAGALRELIAHVLPHDYPDLDLSAARVILVEAADHLLNGFAPKLQRSALRTLRAIGVDVRLNTAVDRLEDGILHLENGGQIAAGTVTWAAGVRAADLAATLAADHSRGGRIVVQPTLQLRDHAEVFVVGDMAAFEQRGAVLPMLAPVAIQEGRHAAESIALLLRERRPQRFHYRDRGMMATIGRSAAVAQIGPFRFSGFLAWLVWLGLHIVTLIGFRNRLFVLINWAWDYFLYDRAVRLILGRTGDERHSD